MLILSFFDMLRSERDSKQGKCGRPDKVFRALNRLLFLFSWGVRKPPFCMENATF